MIIIIIISRQLPFGLLSRCLQVWIRIFKYENAYLQYPSACFSFSWRTFVMSLLYVFPETLILPKNYFSILQEGPVDILGRLMFVKRVSPARFVGPPCHFIPLTPSLPWCHLKTTSKSTKFQNPAFLAFFFATACERVLIKTHSIESRYVIGPENILSAGVCVHLSAHFTCWSSERVN